MTPGLQSGWALSSPVTPTGRSCQHHSFLTRQMQTSSGRRGGVVRSQQQRHGFAGGQFWMTWPRQAHPSKEQFMRIRLSHITSV
jgi:hypothetical protein